MNGGKPIVWLHGEIKTPPFTQTARLEAGMLLRQLQQGETLGMPYAKPIRTIGRRCYELRIRDENRNWRIIYRVDDDAIIIVEVFSKTSRATPKAVIEACRSRLKRYDRITK